MYYKFGAALLLHGVLGTSSIYFYSVLNPIEWHIREFINQTLDSGSRQEVSIYWGVINGAFPVGAAISAILLVLTERLGRRPTLMILNSLLGGTAGLLATASRPLNSLFLLIFARFLQGINITVSGLVFTYVIECSDQTTKKLSPMLVRIGFVCWYILGATAVLPNLLGTEQLWHYALALPALPSAAYLCLTLCIPESPKHLLITQDKEDEARAALRFYQGPLVDEDAVIESLQVEAVSCRESIGLREILSTAHFRRPLTICCIAALACRLGGFDIENFYSTGIMYRLGLSADRAALYNVLILRLPALPLTLVTLLSTNKLSGRLYFLIILCSGCLSTSLLCLSEFISEFSNEDNTLSIVLGIVALTLCIIGWQMGGGYLPYFLPAEICPQVIRGDVLALECAVGGVAGIVITMGYASLSELIGAGPTLVPLVVLCFYSTFWMWKHLPETRDSTVGQIIQQWMPQDDHGDIVSLVSSEENETYYST